MNWKMALEIIDYCERERRGFPAREAHVALGAQESPHLIICVDEFLKCYNSEELLQILRAMVTTYANVSLVTSTLDAFYLSRPEKTAGDHTTAVQLTEARTPSGHDIHYIPLVPILFQNVLTMFDGFQPADPKNAHILSVLCMANGHPRTLQYIHMALKELKKAPMDNKKPDLLSLLKKVAFWIMPNAQPLDFDLVELALRGEAISSTSTIAHGSQRAESFRVLVQRGYFINSITKLQDTTSSVPLLSLLRIYAMLPDLGISKLPANSQSRMDAFYIDSSLSSRLDDDDENGDEDEDESDSGSAPYSAFHSLLEIIKLGAPPIDGASFPTWIENFHCYWEDLRRLSFAIRKKENVSLVAEFYKCGERYPAKCSGSDISIQIPSSLNGPVKEVVKYSPSHLRSPHIFRMILKMNHGNPGFETLIFERNKDGQPIAILIENKTNFPESKNRKYLSISEMKNKIFHCITFFNQTLHGLIAFCSDSFLFFSFF